MKPRQLSFIIATVALSTSTFTHAAELIAAQALLDRVAAARGDVANKTNIADPRIAQLRQNVTNFIVNRSQLPPADAAAQWLALADQARSNADAKMQGTGVNFSEAFAALPEPPAWPELEKLDEKRQLKTANDLALRVIIARLVNHTDQAIAAVDSFAKGDESNDRYMVENLRDQLARNRNQTRESLLKQLDRIVAASARGESSNLELPDLTPTLSEDEAFEALKNALSKIKAPVTAREAHQRAYPWKAALAVVDQLPIAQWGLVQTPEAAPLYEALEKKFGSSADEKNDDARGGGFGGAYIFEEARRNYITSLIRRGDIDKAAQLARKNRQQLFYMTGPEEGVPANKLAAFYLALLKQDPTSRYWNEAAPAAAQAGMTADLLKLAEESLQKPNLNESQRATLKGVIARAKLADDRVEEAIAAFSDVPIDEESGDTALEMALLGAALKNPDLMKRAVTLASKPRRGFGGQPTGYYRSDLPLLLAKNGLAQEAIDFAARNLEVNQGRGLLWLQTIASIYVEQGRAADALTLLEKSPDWSIEDVARTIRHSEHFNHGYNIEPLPLGYITAAALAASGRDADAFKVLHTYLLTDGGNDRAYELLIKLKGAQAMETLDELFALDRFEERPLIWKAVLQQQAGNLEAAEKTARDAIAIDPSDGEEGPPDRLRAYAVLADIRAARGDQKEADFLRGAVAAIRLSEEADLDYAAGLLRRAIKEYKDSLNLFADAYCVQARLAVQMAAIGLNEEAEDHYRRAFELMPNSFGRVESHCFGCEHAFGGEKAQGIAEKVFTGLLQKNPEKAQLHYLLGYLRNQQERSPEAVASLKQAVKLDPDYLNAWKMLSTLSREVKMSPQEQDEAALNLLRLDPTGKHGRGIVEVNDLARLWDAIKSASNRIAEPPTRVFRLAASAEQIERAKHERASQMRGMNIDYDALQNEAYSSLVMSRNPAKTIARDPIISAAIQTMSASRSGFTE